MATMYGGTTQKCKACDKKVYWVEELTADSKIYHKSCFRCHHCKGTLKLGNYSSYDGVLYCKPHFDQLFKMTGRLDKSFEGGAPRAVTKSTEQTKSRFSSYFAGTQEKCLACKKTVYPIEKVAVDGKLYHKACFRCARGGCVISPSNYIAHENRIYCKHHHAQLFKEKGNFSKLDSLEDKDTYQNGNAITPTVDQNDPIRNDITTENGTTSHDTTENGNHNKVAENGDHNKVAENGDYNKTKVAENGDHNKVAENGDHNKVAENGNA